MSQSNPGLQSVSIRGSAVGNVFMADIQQIFINDSDRNIEFLYTFPIPADASVTAFSAKTARGSFKGAVEERETALSRYQDAVTAGDSAFMLESHRDNIFQVSLGNVDKGETTEVNISYLQDLKISGNEIRLVIPTLVGMRYIPGIPVGKREGMGMALPTAQVPDADFITPERGETDYRGEIEIQLTLDSEIRSITSPSHSIVTRVTPETASARLAEATKMNSDFVLNITLAEEVRDTYLTAGQNGEYFSYVSFTPRLPARAVRQPKEFLFMIDVSGSMTGANIKSAKRALKLCLRNMEDGDRFNIIAFESYFAAFAPESVPYDAVNFDKANLWADALFTKGGTEILVALRYAVESAAKSSEWESVILLLTDGQVGNEDELIEFVKKSFKGRVFTLGIDTNVNDSFLSKLADVADGFAEFYYPDGDEDLDRKVVKQFLRSDSPVLKDIKVSDGCETAAALPQTLYGRERRRILFRSKRRAEPFEISGDNGDETVTLRFSPSEIQTGELLSKMWARQRIGSMETEHMGISPRHMKHANARIVEVSKKYGVLCRYTNFIAVDERDEKFRQFPIAAPIPVEPPMIPMSGAAPAAAMRAPSPALFARESPRFSMSAILKRKPRNKKSNFAPLADMEPQAASSYTGDFSWDIGGVYRHMTTLGSGLEAFCEKNLRDILRSLAKDTIDFEAVFFQLDWILSKAWDLWNDAEWLALRGKLLDGLNHAGLVQYLTAQIAAEQNMDGSFGHCEALRKRLTILALSKMTGDDTYLYGRQIRKAFAWADREDWSAAPEEKRGLDGMRA
ncbi:MAG: VWA domain-containing protein [Clostridiales bacterium]|jgi:Ca-activated chloride channel family protein|nr:VWA domain-containing protein [Clostridiales bacterium]